MNDSGGHYYDPKTGAGCHEVPKKDGKGFRKTHVGDARKMGLYPSPTTILKTLHKPELDRWKQIQVAQAALTIPHLEGESNEEFINRIIRDAFEQVDTAADLGSQIHQAIEFYFQGHPHDTTMDPYLDPVRKWVSDNKVQFLRHETRVIDHHLGVAGTCDSIALVDGLSGKTVIDFKSRKTIAGRPVKPWDTEPMQLAAYAAPTGCASALNLYISTTEPGRIEVATYDAETLGREYEAFSHLVSVYRHLNQFPHNPIKS